ncbi:MAG: helix-turn-helix transcriptional regulator [Gemmatimonadota bacterium]|jgi:PadR family transcriptional regulator PadR
MSTIATPAVDMGKSYLGELEQMVLLAVLRLGEEAFAVAVMGELDREAGRKVSRGSLYKTLDRLREKGLVRWRTEDGTPERGGKPRRLFTVTPAGIEALRESREVLLNLWDGVLGTLGGEER